MGFLGSWRTLLRISKNRVTETVDTKLLSKKIIAETERLKLNNISHLFDKNYLNKIDNKIFLGQIELNDFIKAARLGDYENSFKKAFAGMPLLDNPSVKQALQKILDEAATQLPDIKILRNAEVIKNGRQVLVLTDSVRSIDDVSRVVANNTQLKKLVDKLVLSVNRTKKLKFLGYTILVGAVSVTAYDIYKKCTEISANGTGCFLYYTQGQEIKKCKVSSYSCLHPHKGDLCALPLLTNEMMHCIDCEHQDNRQQSCIHCDSDDPYNSNLDEHHMLRCETPDPIDVLLEGIHQTVGGIVSAGSQVFSSIFGHLGILIVVILLVFVIINILLR